MSRVLVALLVALVAYLVFGDHPWDGGIAARLAEGKALRPKDYAATWGWWAALGNAAALAALLATRRSWLRLEPAPLVPSLARPAPPAHWQVGLVLAAMLALAGLAAPRLGYGLWDDELRTVRTAVAGVYLAQEGGALRFHRVSWRDTLWVYSPNNHVAYSVLARLSSAAWRAVLGAPDRRAPERALRLPALVFGMASVASAFLLLWRLGYPNEGVLVAWILVLHPWVLRYASEARGYSLAMTLATATAALLVAALHRGTWRRWLLFGAAQLLLLWTFPGAVAHVTILNLAALAALFQLHRGTPALRTQLARWLLANVAGAMVFLQLMLPNFARLPDYLVSERRSIDLPFVQSTLSHFFAGMTWSWGRRAAPAFPELARLAAAHPGAIWVAIVATAALLALGTARLVAARGVRAALAAVLILPASVTLALAWLRGHRLYAWHLSFGLPGLACLVALGLGALAEVRPRRLSAPLAAALALGYLAALAWWTAEPRAALRSRAFQPDRDSVALTRPPDLFAPEQAGILTASFSSTEPSYYDPFVRKIHEPEELDDLMREADARGRPFFVNLARLDLVARRDPLLLARVRQSELFEEVAALDGFEPRYTRHVYRYRPHAAEAGRRAAPVAASPRSRDSGAR